MSESIEYTNFDNLLKRLLKVPHSDIKAKLDAEKKAKAERREKRPSKK